ncbi:MAG: hypothetical protein D6714_10400 [Bacteroidetes bacterium]|nr:MAG: hypothetical protein D6714_10400 [Bacteroidota bacterium]
MLFLKSVSVKALSCIPDFGFPRSKVFSALFYSCIVFLNRRLGSKMPRGDSATNLFVVYNRAQNFFVFQSLERAQI